MMSHLSRNSICTLDQHDSTTLPEKLNHPSVYELQPLYINYPQIHPTHPIDNGG